MSSRTGVLRAWRAVDSHGALLAAILVAIGFLAVLYSCAIGPYWKLTPDSVSYVEAGQSLAGGKGYSEYGIPTPLYPPGTSAIFAVGWLLGRGSYRVLNAEVVIFTLGAMAICFLFFRRMLGPLAAAIVVLMCLGSFTLFDSTTYLLSEDFYLFFSLLALYLHQKSSSSAEAGAALACTACCMTRLVGFTLALALFIDCMRTRSHRLRRLLFASIPLVFVAIWELRDYLSGQDYLTLGLEKDPYVPAHGWISLAGMLARIAGNCTSFRGVLWDILTNGHPTHPILFVALVVLLGFGFRQLIRGGYVALAIYLVFYLLVALAFCPEFPSRFCVPLLPFIFGCLMLGVQWLAEKFLARGRPVVFALFGIFVCVYLRDGVRTTSLRIPMERSSPFPQESVKFPENYPLQGLAIWMKQHSAPGDRYVFIHPLLMNLMTERVGISYPFADDPDDVEAALRRDHVRYAFVDLDRSGDRHMLLPALTKSGHYRLIKDTARAKLFEFIGEP